MRILIALIALFLIRNAGAQEMKATVQVVAPGVQMTNKSVLTTLQNAIQLFLNSRKWTEETFEAREKIEVSFFFNITKISDANEFTGSLQINSVRPVLNSTYKSTLFSFEDDEIYFVYREFENLDYQENQNLSDLTSLLAFYTNIVIGYDFDSYGDLGGSTYFQKGWTTINTMQGRPGWAQSDGKGGFHNRYYLAENLNNARFQALRKMVYTYHRKGLDIMYEKPDDGRSAITESFKSLQDLISVQPNSLLQKTFFSAKYSEIVEIYKVATVPEKNNILTLLGQLDPVHLQKYEKIKS
jgi:hypothetical protein